MERLRRTTGQNRNDRKFTTEEWNMYTDNSPPKGTPEGNRRRGRVMIPQQNVVPIPAAEGEERKAAEVTEPESLSESPGQ